MSNITSVSDSGILVKRIIKFVTPNGAGFGGRDYNMAVEQY